MSRIARGLLWLSAMLLLGCTEPAPPTVSLDRAAQIGDLDQIKRHIYWKSDLDQSNAAGDPPLHVAVRAGRVTIARELAQHGADLVGINAAGETPLHVALSHGRTQVAAMLVKEGAPLDAQQMLVDLVRAGLIDRDTLAYLLRSGARLNQLDAAGDAPLHVAIKAGQLESVRRLVAAGADVNQADAAGRLPLGIARESAPGRDAPYIVSTLEHTGARANPNP